jgi:hypothetical protein
MSFEEARAAIMVDRGRAGGREQRHYPPASPYSASGASMSHARLRNPPPFSQARSSCR